MSQHARLGKNTLWLLVARFGTQGLMVVFTILIARRLGEVGLGEYAFMASAVFFANVLSTFGTDMLLIREVAAGGGLAQLPAALLVQLLLSVGLVVLTIWGAPTLPNQSAEAIRALQIYSWALFPLAFYSVFTAALRGKERMDWYTLLNLAVSLLQVGAVGLFVGPGGGASTAPARPCPTMMVGPCGSVVTIAWLLFVIQIVAALIAGLICLRYIPNFLQAWHFSNLALATLLRASAPIALLGLLGMLYQKLSVYMLSTLSGAALTGWFSAALRIVEASKTGHLALFGALYPAMAQAQASPTETGRWREVFAFSWKLLLAAAAVAALAMFFLALPLVHLLYGSGFEPAADALKILAWLIIPYTISAYLSLKFLAAGRERWVAQALLAGVISLALLNTWWIPSAGLVGACWAALLAELVQASFLIFQQWAPLKFTLFKKSERIS